MKKKPTAKEKRYRKAVIALLFIVLGLVGWIAYLEMRLQFFKQALEATGSALYEDEQAKGLGGLGE